MLSNVDKLMLPSLYTDLLVQSSVIVGWDSVVS